MLTVRNSSRIELGKTPTTALIMLVQGAGPGIIYTHYNVLELSSGITNSDTSLGGIPSDRYDITIHFISFML